MRAEQALTYRVFEARLEDAPASGETELRKVQLTADRPAATPRERYATTINGQR